MIYDTVAFIIYAKKDKNDEIYSIFSRDVFFNIKIPIFSMYVFEPKKKSTYSTCK